MGNLRSTSRAHTAHTHETSHRLVKSTMMSKTRVSQPPRCLLPNRSPPQNPSSAPPRLRDMGGCPGGPSLGGVTGKAPHTTRVMYCVKNGNPGQTRAEAAPLRTFLPAAGERDGWIARRGEMASQHRHRHQGGRVPQKPWTLTSCSEGKVSKADIEWRGMPRRDRQRGGGAGVPCRPCRDPRSYRGGIHE